MNFISIKFIDINKIIKKFNNIHHFLNRKSIVNVCLAANLL
jgi:hypothetical protein